MESSLEGEPPRTALSVLFIVLNSLTVWDFAELLFILVLIFCSALMSGSESAFFSLNTKDLLDLQESKSKNNQTVVYLHERPKLLLATILIANTFINILIAIMATRFLANFGFGGNEVLRYMVSVILVTFILVLLGEVVPKVYANTHNIKHASFMAYPLLVLSKIFYPFSILLIGATGIIEKRIQKKGHNVSLDEIRHAIEITSGEETTTEEKNILRGIISFGNTYVKQIMRSRVDVSAHDIKTPFRDLVNNINENRYSRLPVYKESFDNIEGILYIKDLIPHLGKQDFEWQRLIRPAYFVPESKKIDSLLQEFKTKKVHLAIVIDEYGGTSGIVTLEDILEEIVGDIHDEFDEEEIFYSRLDDDNFVFDGKTSLTDVVRVMDLDEDVFEAVRGEAESIGGMVVEISGKMPSTGAKVEFKNFEIVVESVDRRRVRRVKLSRVHDHAEHK